MDSQESNSPKKISRRDFLKTAGIVGAGILVAGCAPTTATQTQIAGATEALTSKTLTAPAVLKGTSINVWSGFYASANYKQWYDFVGNEFMKSHPGVTVTVQSVGFDQITKAKAAIAGGGGIGDVTSMLPSVFGLQCFQAGLLEDLTSYYQKDADWQSYTDIWKLIPPGNYRWPQTPDGAIYSSNESNGPSFVWYWADMFDKLGGYPETIDGLLEAIAKAKTDLPDIQGLCSAGFNETWHCDYWYYALESKYDFTGDVARKCVAGKAKWSTSPEIRQGLDLWNNLYAKGLFDPGVIQENYDPDSKDLLKNRKVAMFYSSGPWMSGYMNPADKPKIGTGYLPKVKSGDPNVYTANNDMGHVIWKVSDPQKNQSYIDLRVEYLKAMASADAQRLLFTLGIMPVWSKASDQPIAADNYDILTLKQQMDLLAKADYGVDNNTYYSNETDALDSGMVNMLLGTKTTDQELKDLDAAQAKDFPS
jgi:ABC-type glycerol-3-phosphate transport system substrate-binding protein